MEQFAHSASKKLAAAGREIRYIEYRLKKKAQQQKHTGNGPSGSKSSSRSKGNIDPTGNTEVEAARPQTANEEDLQLQLALEMSKAEADNAKKAEDKEDIRLKLAIEQSLKEEDSGSPKKQQQSSSSLSSSQSKPKQQQQSGLLDLGDPWATSAPAQTKPVAQQATADPFSTAPSANDPWGFGMPGTQSSSAITTTNAPATNNANVQVSDPWGTPTPTQQQPVQQQATTTDPWGASTAPTTTTQQNNFDPWGSGGATQQQSNGDAQQQASSDPFSNAFSSLSVETSNIQQESTTPPAGASQQEESDLSKKFLGGVGADLVNLDSLMFTQQTTTAPPTSNTAHLQSVPAHNNNKHSISPNAALYASEMSSNNPFASSIQQSTGSVFSTGGLSNNPFAPAPAHMGPTLNQLKAQTAANVPNSFVPADNILVPSTQHNPTIPSPVQAQFNQSHIGGNQSPFGMIQPSQTTAQNSQGINPFM